MSAPVTRSTVPSLLCPCHGRPSRMEAWPVGGRVVSAHPLPTSPWASETSPLGRGGRCPKRTPRLEGVASPGTALCPTAPQ